MSEHEDPPYGANADLEARSAAEKFGDTVVDDLTRDQPVDRGAGGPRHKNTGKWRNT